MAATTHETPIEDLPAADLAFHIEQHGVDFVPEHERWATARDVGAMWAGASVNVEYFLYGAILLSFGFTFAQTVWLIVIGNLSYLLLGLCSLQGPETGTTVFGTNRAAFGPNGSRMVALFNWLTQIGFEVEGLILIVGAAILLSVKAGFDVGTPAKVLFILGAVGVQFVLPFLGHATIVRVLRLLILPFVAIFIVFLVLSTTHAHLHAVKTGAGWETLTAGLAFTIALSGLGWTECGNDYTRYCPPDTPKKSIVGWVFLTTAVPQILVMTLGAAVGTFIVGIGHGESAFLPFAHQSVIPSWFVVVFMIFAMVQLFAINSLDMYSSGVTLQALGVHVKRYQAVLIDTAICLAVTSYAIFNSSFTTFLGDFVAVVIIWIAPWMSIYLLDWALRRYRYVPAELQKTGPGGLYYRSGGIFWPAVIAQLVGMVAAMSAVSATFLPSWANPISAHHGGADFSIYLGIGVAGAVYLLLGWRGVRSQAARQGELLGAGRV